MSWRRGQNNPFQGPQGPRPHVPQPGPWGQNAQGAWQQNPGQGFRNPNAQGQRFQNPQQNQQNNANYREPNRAGSTTEEYQNDYDSDDSIARRDHLRRIEAELQQMRIERDRYQRDFENLRDSGPPPTRTPTLAEMSNEIKYTVRSNSHNAGKFSMLPPQQQQVANMTKEINKLKDDLIHLASFITVTETTNESGRFTDVLTNLRRSYLEKVKSIAIMEQEVKNANDLSSKFDVNLPMPDFSPAPPGFRFDPTHMDFRNILKFTGKFNPNKDTEQKFSQFWIKIVQYGSGKYLNEDEYISILKYTVYGVAITDLMSLIEGGNSLTEIVNGLAALYDDVETLDDFKHQVDNFSRAKNETITKAMTRAMNLIEKLSPLHAKGSWLDRKEDMGKSILKQIVDEKTRIFIDMEETKMVRAGASLTLKQLVKLAFDHEKYHKSIPTKEINTTFQVASMTPRTKPPKDDEKAHLRKELSVAKGLEEKLEKFMEATQMQIAAAHFKERARTAENFNKKKSYEKSQSRSASASSQKSSGSALPDEDDLMDFSEIENRADKPQQKPQQHQQKSNKQNAERGRSQEKKYYENRSQSKSPSHFNKSQNNKTQYVKHGENKQPSFQRVPANSRLIAVGDKRYFDCDHCGSFHKVGKVCYLVQSAQIAAQEEESGN